MLYILQTAGLAFMIAVLLAPAIIQKLHQLRFGQKILEDGPTWHKEKQNTPTMGGVIFILAMGLSVLTCLPQMIVEKDFRPLVMLGLSLIFAAVGFVDDWTKIKKKRNQGLTAKQKLLLQIAAAVLFLVVMRVMGYLTASFYIPFFGVTWELPWAVYLIFSVFIIIGADNAVNLTDGIDGLCSSVTMIVAIFSPLSCCGKAIWVLPLHWRWLADFWDSSCSISTRHGCSWAIPVRCFWAAQYAQWHLPMICRWC